MKKIFIVFFILFSFFIKISAQQNFGYFASAVWLKDSSYTGFFNTLDTSDANAISNNPFINFNDTLLGIFPQNSGSLQIGGGEIKTFKSSEANVCGAAIYYTVYPEGNRPASPVYTSMDLAFFSNCTGGVFDVGGGPCATGDQKFQTITPLRDLTNLSPGTYTLEIYYRETGSNSATNGCSDTTYDNNNSASANYTATFIITQALPVTLINFKASYNRSSVILNWTVADEINEKGFEIERSTDAASFSAVSFIPSKGNSTAQLKYSYTDKTLPVTSKVFYRLKMISNDGSEKYSSLLPVNLGTIAHQFAAQLTKTKLTIHFSGTLGNKSLLQLTDMQGRILLKENVAVQTESPCIFSVSPAYFLSAGIYIVSIYDGVNFISNKIALTQ